jgi:hypothetical protein
MHLLCRQDLYGHLVGVLQRLIKKGPQLAREAFGLLVETGRRIEGREVDVEVHCPSFTHIFSIPRRF